MTPAEYRQIELLVAPRIRGFIGRLRATPVGYDDLLQETLLKGLKRGLKLIGDEGLWCKMADDTCFEAIRRENLDRKASMEWLARVESPVDHLWQKLEDILEGQDWAVQKAVRMLRSGESLKVAAEGAGLSPWQLRKRLLKLRNSVTSVTE
jgi:DNA-directed RNA polymerase specialized sigma24 family protein